jgi:predicted transcriptional regulator
MVLSQARRLGSLQQDLLQTLAEHAAARTTRQLADELRINKASPVLVSLQSLALVGLVRQVASTRHARGWSSTWACTRAGLVIAGRIARGEL